MNLRSFCRTGLVCVATFSGLIPETRAQAPSPGAVRLGYSQRLGIEVVADDAGWCKTNLMLRVVADHPDVFRQPDLLTLLQQLGIRVIGKQCPAAQDVQFLGSGKDDKSAVVWRASASSAGGWLAKSETGGGGTGGVGSTADLDSLPPSPASTLPGPSKSVVGLDVAGLYRQAPIDGLTLSLALNRMNGTTPDLREFAERSNAYMNATAFDRDAVRTREIARLEGQLRTFDLDRTYTLKLNMAIKQYDPSRLGYPLDLSPESGIGFNDPTFHSTILQFTNVEEVNFIPMGDPIAARNFAQRFKLNMQYEQAGNGLLDLALRLVDAPPVLNNGQNVVRAEILAARLETQDGHLMADLGTTKASTITRERAASGQTATPVLKAADTQGFRIGMSMAEADALGTRNWTKRVGTNGAAAYFNGLKGELTSIVRCGETQVVSGTANFGNGFGTDFSFDSCLAVQKQQANIPGKTDEVRHISARQFLPSVAVATILAALTDKYGKPVYVRNNGSNLVWIGRDPSRPDQAPVVVEADVRAQGQQPAGAVVLSIEIGGYVDPRPAPVQAPASEGPKL